MMDELQASPGFVAGLTGLVSGVIGWLSMRDKCDKSTCVATHKGVDASLTSILLTQHEMKEDQRRIIDKIDELRLIVLHNINK